MILSNTLSLPFLRLNYKNNNYKLSFFLIVNFLWIDSKIKFKKIIDVEFFESSISQATEFPSI